MDDPSAERAPLEDVVLAGELRCSLEEAALHLARQEYADLEPAPWLRELDGFAERVRVLISADAPAPEVIGAASDVLFRELGFRGNDEDYYAPTNSFLNVVLETRRGIPISLAVVYQAVVRRLGLKLEGTAFPGHFLLLSRRPGWPILIDCYHGGRILTEEDCRSRLAALGHETWDPRCIDAVPDTTILRRMLNNLKLIYLKQRDWERLRKTVLQMFVVTPEDYEELLTLGVALAGVGRRADAIAHLERLLELCPDTPNRSSATRMLAELRDPSEPNQ